MAALQDLTATVDAIAASVQVAVTDKAALLKQIADLQAQLANANNDEAALAALNAKLVAAKALLDGGTP